MSSEAHGAAYAAAGVDYDQLDPVKRLALEAGKATSGALQRYGMAEVPGTRGESAYVVDAGDHYLATLTEGLGTKNLVADAVRDITGRSHYDQVAQDAVATILNDLATVGAAPLVVTAYWGTGASDWFADQARAADLIHGWAQACAAAGAAWGGGETQALSGIIQPGTTNLAGAALGIVRPKDRLLGGHRLEAGDAILLAPASGIHANGLTLARSVAARLPLGYRTPLPGDPLARTYGEALLDPQPLYGPLVAALQDAGVPLHYAAHVTGHGWRKFMRAERDLSYVVDHLPPVPPVLSFLQRQEHLSDAEAYGTFNMGAGYALFVGADGVVAALSAAHGAGFDLLHAGRIEPGPRRVVIEPHGIAFEGATLRVR